MKEWHIGTDNDTHEERAMTFVIVELNHYVQITNWKEEGLSIAKFKGKLRGIETIERRIAMKKLKLEKHEMKWKEIYKLIR